MYRMPLNYNPETTKSSKMTKDNNNTRGAMNTSGIDSSRGPGKATNTRNQLFVVRPRDIVNSNETMTSKVSVDSKGTMTSRDNVYSNESFDTNNSKNYISQSEKTSSLEFTNLSPKKLQEAIIWSEILGKPVSKREKRR